MLSHVLGDRTEITNKVFLLFLLSVPFLTIFTVIESVTRILIKKERFFSLVFTSNSLLLSLIFITYFVGRQDLADYVIAISVAWVLIGIFSLFCAKQYLHCYIEVQSILNGLKYSIPLAGTSFLTGCSLSWSEVSSR